MNILGIHSVIRRKKRKYKKSSLEAIAENILNRDFHADDVNQKWSTDVSEFRVPGTDTKLYLSTIFDLYDRYIVSWEISKSNNNQLVFKTFDKAMAENPDAKPIFHSDRGFQYTSREFQSMVREAGMEQSMSRVSHCIDNGPTEGLWGTIKSEMYALYDITDEDSLRKAMEGYIYFYNNLRPQSRFNCKTPAEVREEALSTGESKDYPIAVNKRIEKYKEKWIA